MELHSIGQVARLLGVAASTLRLWEREGLVQPARTPGGTRRWSQADIEQARRVAYLRRVEKVNYAAIRHLVRRPVARSRAPTARELGSRLRAFREASRLTLREVATRSRLSVSFVSSLERGLVGASVSTWERLLSSQGATLLSILGEGGDSARRLVRPSDRRVFNTGSGVRIEHLAVGPALMEPQVFRIEPGAGSEGPYHHEGEACLYMLQGRLDFWLGGNEHYALGPGDCLYCPSNVPHTWQNRGKRVALVLWVNTPPTF